MRRRGGASPGSRFDFIEGGAGSEVTLRRNTAAFDRLTLRPRHLVDVSERSLRTSVLGQEIAMPILIAPTGMARIAGAGAEVEGARAAGRAGTDLHAQHDVERLDRGRRAGGEPARSGSSSTSGPAPRSPTTCCGACARRASTRSS